MRHPFKETIHRADRLDLGCLQAFEIAPQEAIIFQMHISQTKSE